jgi:hypothetical protein
MMSLIFAHAEHSHGPDPGLLSLIAVVVLLAAWAAVAALRTWHRRSRSAAAEAHPAAPVDTEVTQ